MKKDRRTDKREATKEKNFSSNKISKIIFLKNIILPVVVSLVGVIYLSISAINGYLNLTEIDKKNQNIIKKIENINSKMIKLKQSNTNATIKLAQENPNIIDKSKIEPLVKKVVNLMSLKQIINTATVEINPNQTYQNVLNIDIQTEFNQQYLTTDIVKNIITLVFDQFFYIKDVSILDKTIKFQIYKKVT